MIFLVLLMSNVFAGEKGQVKNYRFSLIDMSRFTGTISNHPDISKKNAKLVSASCIDKFFYNNKFVKIDGVNEHYFTSEEVSEFYQAIQKQLAPLDFEFIKSFFEKNVLTPAEVLQLPAEVEFNNQSRTSKKEKTNILSDVKQESGASNNN